MRGLALALWLVLLVQPATAKASFLVGNWYGEQQPHDPNVLWLARFWPDGRFQAKFRTCRPKDFVDEVDEGTWTYNGRITEVTSTFVNGSPMHVVDRYDTISYDGRKHVYRHERTGFVFTAVRVDDKFELPSCNMSS